MLKEYWVNVYGNSVQMLYGRKWSSKSMAIVADIGHDAIYRIHVKMKPDCGQKLPKYEHNILDSYR